MTRLAVHRLALARTSGTEGLAPINGADHLFDLGTGHARSVRGANQGAHAGAGNAVDRDAQLFKQAQHPDMCCAPCSTAAQHQTQAQTVLALGTRGDWLRVRRVIE
jgi:hypothetical protein